MDGVSCFFLSSPLPRSLYPLSFLSAVILSLILSLLSLSLSLSLFPSKKVQSETNISPLPTPFIALLKRILFTSNYNLSLFIHMRQERGRREGERERERGRQGAPAVFLSSITNARALTGQDRSSAQSAHVSVRFCLLAVANSGEGGSMKEGGNEKRKTSMEYTNTPEKRRKTWTQ
jgi:hypothetical protein